MQHSDTNIVSGERPEWSCEKPRAVDLCPARCIFSSMVIQSVGGWRGMAGDAGRRRKEATAGDTVEEASRCFSVSVRSVELKTKAL